MKSEPLGKRNSEDSNALAISPGNSRPAREFEHRFEWVRLGASLEENNLACVEQHQRVLRAQGETEKRLSELHHWHQSPAFTEQEKADLSGLCAVLIRKASPYSQSGGSIYERKRKRRRVAKILLAMATLSLGIGALAIDALAQFFSRRSHEADNRAATH